MRPESPGRTVATTAAARRQQTLSLIQNSGGVQVAELGRYFGVSDVTIRSDLAALSRQGLVVRVHGGAKLPERAGHEPPFLAREGANAHLKMLIARAALELVPDHSSIILDASTTSLYLARLLREEAWTDLTVITNGIRTALELMGTRGVVTILTGGEVRETAASVIGPPATELLARVHGAIGFFGARGLSASDGLTDVNLREVEVKMAMVQACRQVVALVDHEKLGQVALATFAPASRVDLVITDREADPAVLSDLRAGGLEVRCA